MSDHQRQFQVAAICLLIIGIINLLLSGMSFILAILGGVFHVSLKILFILSMILPLVKGLAIWYTVTAMNLKLGY